MVSRFVYVPPKVWPGLSDHGWVAKVKSIHMSACPSAAIFSNISAASSSMRHDAEVLELLVLAREPAHGVAEDDLEEGAHAQDRRHLVRPEEDAQAVLELVARAGDVEAVEELEDELAVDEEGHKGDVLVRVRGLGLGG